MRLSTSEQRYSQCKNNINFSGARYFPKKPFCWFNNFDGLKQRASLGVAALAFQPAIDYFNPMTDEKTRKFSVLKTIVKVVVGTISGLLVRGAVIKLINKSIPDISKFTKGSDGFKKAEEKLKKFTNNIKDAKLRETVNNIFKDSDKKKKFTDNLATVVGLIAVGIGDFTVDMPIAKAAIQITADAFGMTEYNKKEVKK